MPVSQTETEIGRKINIQITEKSHQLGTLWPAYLFSNFIFSKLILNEHT